MGRPSMMTILGHVFCKGGETPAYRELIIAEAGLALVNSPDGKVNARSQLQFLPDDTCLNWSGPECLEVL